MKSENAEKQKCPESAAPALALWALLARNSIFKILGVLGLTVCAETILFYSRMGARGDYNGEYLTLEAAVKSSHISLVFFAALGLLYLVLLWTEGRLESRSSGIIRRLRLFPREIFWIKTAYNGVCIILLFAVQIWLCIWLAGVHGRAVQETYPLSGRLFLAFYRIDFLHCLLPMAEAVKWVRNLLLVLAFAVEAAGRVEKTEYVPPILLYTLTTGWFISPLGGSVTDWIGMLLYGFVTAVNVWRVYKTERGKT